ncbi:hypothetical protein [Devosia sediminis]|uniref:Uncharacterized protein n=1 Tax=Devosia sediminis TaxID=2798801 RepID=A0A934MNB1_9HYPH|nr:hypothetical protein [Devosia sediminis]MBJ3787050.1 hypothetical protein [Devosia sediminis]
MRKPVLLPPAVLAMMAVAPVAAQDDTWTPLAFSGDDVVFALGGPDTRNDAREISLAIVPPEGFVGFGEEVGYVLNFYALNCTERTSRHHTMHVFGKDGNIVSIQSLDQPDEAVPPDGSAMDLAVRLKCFADPPSVTGGVEQSRLIETANALRGTTRG